MAGELLRRGEELLKMGLHTSEVIEGYERAFETAIAELDKLVVEEIRVFDRVLLQGPVETAIASKQYGLETLLARLAVDAALTVMGSGGAGGVVAPKKNFPLIESVRIVKILGGTVTDSTVVPGMVLPRAPETRSIRRACKAKVAVYSCPIDVGRTETKGTVLLRGAEELLAFSAEEERDLGHLVQQIADTGVKVVVTGATIGDMALHFLERHGLMAVKVPSKWDLQRLCRVLGATASARLGPLHPQELGYCESIDTLEIGADRVTVFSQSQSPDLLPAPSASSASSSAATGSGVDPMAFLARWQDADGHDCVARGHALHAGGRGTGPRGRPSGSAHPSEGRASGPWGRGP